MNGNLSITSTAFVKNSDMPQEYTCDGKNINPPLQFSNVPEKAKSLVLIMDDPDAPNGTWVHWLVWNIDTKTAVIPEQWNVLGAVEGKTSLGKPGYHGPCPPSGVHHYHFKLYALDSTLTLTPDDNKGALEEAMSDHIIEETELIGLYEKEINKQEKEVL